MARTTPRPYRSARTESGCSATSRFVTTTSSVAIGNSSSAGSSTSSPSGRLPPSSTLRRAPMATTSPDCSTVSGVASSSSAPRRMRSTKTRSGLAARSKSATVRPAADVGQPVGADAPFLVGQVNFLRPRRRRPRQLSRQFLALRLHVDAKQAWRRGRQKPDDESRAHQVADRIGHGDVVLQPRLLGLGQLEPVDRVAGGSDHRRFGERTGHQAGRGPGVVAKQLRRHERRHQARHAEDDRQRDLGQRILLQAAKELRPDLVAGGKQEQREEDRLDRGIDLDVELSDEHARDERAQDVAELEGPYPDPADHEADGERQEDRQFRVGAKGIQHGS